MCDALAGLGYLNVDAVVFVGREFRAVAFVGHSVPCQADVRSALAAQRSCSGNCVGGVSVCPWYFCVFGLAARLAVSGRGGLWCVMLDGRCFFGGVSCGLAAVWNPLFPVVVLLVPRRADVLTWSMSVWLRLRTNGGGLCHVRCCPCVSP